MSIRGFFEDIFGDDLVEGFTDIYDYFTKDETGQGIASLLASYGLNQSGLMDPKIPQVGYQGGIPDYTVARRQVPVATGIEQINQTVRPMGTTRMEAGDVASTGLVMPLRYDPNRRPGSGGRRYFTDIDYVPTGRDMGEDKEVDSAAMTAAQERQEQQVYDLLRRNLSNPAREERSKRVGALPLMAGPMPAGPRGQPQDPVPVDDPSAALPPGQDGGLAQGGIAELKKGKYLNGNTDGMVDKVPATIEGKQPAALSDGEFVIPADVVSHLGNGNSDAGAKILEQMMARVRKERTGNKEQGKEINARNMLPV
ncbi:MAG: hypothetical protein CMJ25_15815 [Phycisphaerae bacterium]|nr:hypothetical protein [Phycisphaerae bacterium]